MPRIESGHVVSDEYEREWYQRFQYWGVVSFELLMPLDSKKGREQQKSNQFRRAAGTRTRPQGLNEVESQRGEGAKGVRLL